MPRMGLFTDKEKPHLFLEAILEISTAFNIDYLFDYLQIN
mgnify:CR=1 FL=1